MTKEARFPARRPLRRVGSSRFIECDCIIFATTRYFGLFGGLFEVMILSRHSKSSMKDEL